MAGFGLVIILLGIALWMGGRRGFLVGNHPYCKKCGFDLFALPLETRRCPECGSDIFADNAIRVGHHRPIVPLILTGALLSTSGAALIGWTAVGWWPQFDGSSFKPISWLERDIDSHDSQKRRRACSELERRIASDSLAPGQLDQIARAVLKLQGNPALTWNPHWGDLVQKAESGDAGHRLSAALWQQYVAQALSVTAEVRPRVRLGDPIPIRLICRLRTGSDFTALEGVTIAPTVHITLGKISGTVETPHRSLTPASADEFASSSMLQWNLFWIPSQPAGPGTAPLETDVSAGAHVIQLAATLIATQSTDPLATCTQNFSVPLKFLPAGESSVHLLHAADLPATPAEESTATQIARSIRLSGTQNDTPATAPFVFERGHTLGNLWISSPPVCLSCSVVLRQHASNGSTREWSLARLMVRPNDAASIPLRLEIHTFDERPDDGPAEIVCLPDATPAAGTVDINEVWGDPVTLPINLQISDF